MDFIRSILINQTDSIAAALDIKAVAEEIKTIFPRCKVGTRPLPFVCETALDQAKIADIKQPFEKQQNLEQDNSMMTISLYDGFVMQRMFGEIIPSEETDLVDINIIFTNLLPCTFNEDDWRYHGRAVICGTPSIVSTTGIVEALAKPREFYLAQIGSVRTDNTNLKKKFAGRFIDYNDKEKITAASINYALQTIFFFITDGEPFCNDKDCRLYNAHWQEELIHIIEKRTLCIYHTNLVNKFQ
ncbi:MAG: DUF6775 family putative metallopeptidase [Nitrososphaera sp.]